MKPYLSHRCLISPQGLSHRLGLKNVANKSSLVSGKYE